MFKIDCSKHKRSQRKEEGVFSLLTSELASSRMSFLQHSVGHRVIGPAQGRGGHVSPLGGRVACLCRVKRSCWGPSLEASNHRSVLEVVIGQLCLPSVSQN